MIGIWLPISGPNGRQGGGAKTTAPALDFSINFTALAACGAILPNAY
ncbi:MAG: hypothetical protein ACREEU_11065 [Acetobacteraceae bacterium]